MSQRRIRARQKANARKRARMQRRHAAREAEIARELAVKERLEAHNQSRRDPYGLRLSITHFEEQAVVYPQRLDVLLAKHPAMEVVQRCNPNVKLAFARLITWAGKAARELVEAYPHGLRALAQQHEKWLRPVEEAPLTGKSPRTRFLAVTRFLLEKYPAPRSLLYTFLAPQGGPVGWYAEVAQGKSLRHVVDVTGFTKRAAHLFPKAPRDYRIVQAVRWAQVRALGGSEGLARMVAERGPLSFGWMEKREAFWHHWMAWMVAHPEFPLSRVTELQNFLRILLGHNPKLTMKGRSPMRLLAILDEARREFEKEQARTLETFKPSGVNPATYTIADGRPGFERAWTFEEILDSEALYREGKAMRHCVASYDDCIRDQESAIFSLRKTFLGESKRMLTVEVTFEEKGRVFGEVRGKANREPTAEEMAIVKRWGRRECIRFEG